MVLTEPHAGTDLGLMRTRAEPQADGSYRVTRHQDLHHQRRARPHREHRAHGAREAARTRPRARAASACSWCRSSCRTRRASPGDANGVSCASVEHKLGIHGSATCVMNFDGSQGWLIGEVNGGLKCMFTMMNHARLWVGLQGLAQCERGWQASLAYARERRQGRTSEGGKAAGRPHHRPPGRAAHAADAEIADRGRARADLVRGPCRWTARCTIRTPRRARKPRSCSRC